MANATTGQAPSRRIIRFGVFDFDLKTGELRKHGLLIKLQGQPVDVLAMLLEHPGEVVTREDLQKRLWPADVYVDFELSLNAAVKRLRAALGDSADTPRFVETLSRRGYRFVAPISLISEPPSPLAPAQASPIEEAAPAAAEILLEETPPAPARRRILPWVVAGTMAAIAFVALLLVWRATRPVSQPLMKLSLDLPDFAITSTI